jgi:ABC-type transporter MlaC component
VRGAGATLLFAVLLALTVAAPAQEPLPADDAADLVLRQLAALRAHDFGQAYAFASAELRRHFTRSEFEWMVKRAHPEVASSSHAFIVRTHEAAGFAYVTVKIQGRNGQNVEALYEMVREKGQWKVNALSSRRDDGVL